MKKRCRNKDLCGTVMPSEKDNILKFNQYIKSDKMQYIIYADIGSLIKKYMDVQTIQKILQQQKQVSIFLDIHCQQFGHLITQTTNVLYIAGKIV